MMEMLRVKDQEGTKQRQQHRLRQRICRNRVIYMKYMNLYYDYIYMYPLYLF